MNKTLKAFIAILLAGLMIVATAFSTSAVGVDTTVSQDVILDFVSGDVDYKAVYSVDIMWNNLDFAYTDGSMAWNPLEHSYNVPTADAGWTDDIGKVTVDNHSNAAVNIDVIFEPADEPNGTAILVIENSSFPLASAEGTSFDEPPQGVAYIFAQGIPESDDSLGKITVAVNSTEHKHSWSDGTCTECGEACSHPEFVEGVCSVCGKDIFVQPTVASVYSGTPDVSWFDEANPKSEYGML